jgi:hypothetical protein
MKKTNEYLITSVEKASAVRMFREMLDSPIIGPYPSIKIWRREQIGEMLDSRIVIESGVKEGDVVIMMRINKYV